MLILQPVIWVYLRLVAIVVQQGISDVIIEHL